MNSEKPVVKDTLVFDAAPRNCSGSLVFEGGDGRTPGTQCVGCVGVALVPGGGGGGGVGTAVVGGTQTVTVLPQLQPS